MSEYFRLKRKTNKAELSKLGFSVDYFPNYVQRELDMHSLDIVLFSVFLEGDATHHIDDMRFDESGGSIGITHYGKQHSIITGTSGIEIANIYVDLERHPLPQLPSDLESVLPLFLPLHPNFGNRLNQIVRFRFEDKAVLKQLVLELYHELQNKAPAYEIIATNLFQHFLIQCCREVLREGVLVSDIKMRSANRNLEELRQYLDHNYAKELCLDDLAERCGLSGNYLCRQFKRYTGKTVFDYILDRRIQAAMLALRKSDMKIASVSSDCGFNDLSYFNRSFKKRLNCSPREYRQRFL